MREQRAAFLSKQTAWDTSHTREKGFCLSELRASKERFALDEWRESTSLFRSDPGGAHSRFLPNPTQLSAFVLHAGH